MGVLVMQLEIIMVSFVVFHVPKFTMLVVMTYKKTCSSNVVVVNGITII